MWQRVVNSNDMEMVKSISVIIIVLGSLDIGKTGLVRDMLDRFIYKSFKVELVDEKMG